MIFQDPLSSLNPLMRIGKQITEAIIINGNKLKLMYEDLIYEENVAYHTLSQNSVMKSILVPLNFSLKVGNKFKAQDIRADKALTKEEKRAKLDALVKKKKLLI